MRRGLTRVRHASRYTFMQIGVQRSLAHTTSIACSFARQVLFRRNHIKSPIIHAMTDPKDIKVGDEVEWKWGGAKHISGHVVDKQEEGKAQIESKGKTITRNAEPDNPAYTIEGARNPVLKKGSELEKTGDGEEDDEEEEEVPEAADDDEEAEDDEEADEAAAAGDAPASSGVRTRAQAQKAVS